MTEFNWQNIVGSTVRNLPTMLAESPHFRGHRVWFAVAEICGLGSTSACELCKAIGVDPDAIVGRCRHCDWPLKAETKDGCTTGSCSQRPSVQRRNWEGAK